MEERFELGYHTTNKLLADRIRENGFKPGPNGVYFTPQRDLEGDTRLKTYCRQGTSYLFSNIFDVMLGSEQRDHYAKNEDACLEEAVRLANTHARNLKRMNLTGEVIPKDVASLPEFQGALIKARIPHSLIVPDQNGKIVDGVFEGKEIVARELGPEHIAEIQEVNNIYPDYLIVDMSLSEILASPMKTGYLNQILDFPRVGRRSF